MQDQIDKIFEQFDRTGSSIRQASARSDARPQAFPPSRQRRSPASNLCIGSGRVSSNSVDWAPRATRLPRFGMRFSLRDSKQLHGACLARPQNVCTTTLLKTHNVGLGFAEPVQQVRQATVDVVDVETGDLHRFRRERSPLGKEPVVFSRDLPTSGQPPNLTCGVVTV